MIDLFAHEHFIAHKLLAHENPDNDKLVYAYTAMSFMSNKYTDKRYTLTPEEYEEAKIAFSEMLKQRYSNKENHPSFGTHISEERKRLIGDINRGNTYCLGRVLSDETKKKIGDANRNPSDETRKKMSAARKGKKLGSQNSNAKQVIRLSDKRVYGCAKEAALDNNQNYSTFKHNTQNGNGFMYYTQWLKENNLGKIS